MPDVFDESVSIDISNNPVSAPPPAQQVYYGGNNHTVFLGAVNKLPIFYNVNTGNAALAGLGVRVHYSSSQVATIGFSNTLATSLLAVDSIGQADINDFDNDLRTDRYLTIGWADINANWPGSLPIRLFNLDVQLKDDLTSSDTLVIRFSRTSNASGYALALPSLEFDVLDDNFDIDGDGRVEALSDALMILRWGFGFSDNSLVANAIATGATRTDAASILTRLEQLAASFDVDGNGSFDALTDGLLVMRYMFGFRDSVLISGAVGGGATRVSAADIEAYLSGFVPTL